MTTMDFNDSKTAVLSRLPTLAVALALDDPNWPISNREISELVSFYSALVQLDAFNTNPSISTLSSSGLSSSSGWPPSVVRPSSTQSLPEQASGTLIRSEFHSITLAAEKDSDRTDGHRFSEYLSGVSLSNTFTATVGSNVTKVWYRLDRTGPWSTDASGQGSTWTFTYDMGQLDPGEHRLAVIGFDEHGVLVGQAFAAIEVQDQIALELEAVVPGAGTREIEQVRFLQEIAIPNLQLRITSEDLPLPEHYANALQLHLGPEVSALDLSDGARQPR
jgi:hypothetical protein